MVRRSGPGGWAGRSPVRWPAELLTGVGFAVIIAATVVAAIIFGPHQPVGRLTVLAVAVAGFAAVAGDLLAALATVVIGWLFLNGMLIDQHAVLRWPRHRGRGPADGSGGCRTGGNGLRMASPAASRRPVARSRERSCGHGRFR